MAGRDQLDRQPDLDSEHVTGDQPIRHRKRRGRFRRPKWREVRSWRDRWTEETVITVPKLLRQEASAEAVGEATGFGTISVKIEEGITKNVSDLRGLDLALIPLEMQETNYSVTLYMRNLDLSHARLEGSRLTNADLRSANLRGVQVFASKFCNCENGYQKSYFSRPSSEKLCALRRASTIESRTTMMRRDREPCGRSDGAGRIEAKWIDAFAEVLRRGAVGSGEVCVILPESRSRAVNVEFADLPLRNCTGTLVNLIVVDRGRLPGDVP